MPAMLRLLGTPVVLVAPEDTDEFGITTHVYDTPSHRLDDDTIRAAAAQILGRDTSRYDVDRLA